MIPLNRVISDKEGNFGQCVLNGKVSCKSVYPGNFGHTFFLSLLTPLIVDIIKHFWCYMKAEMLRKLGPISII